MMPKLFSPGRLEKDTPAHEAFLRPPTHNAVPRFPPPLDHRGIGCLLCDPRPHQPKARLYLFRGRAAGPASGLTDSTYRFSYPITAPQCRMSSAPPNKRVGFIITGRKHVNKIRASVTERRFALPPITARERAMLNNLSEQIRKCLQQAEDCGRQAAAQTDLQLRQDFLDMERRWLFWARSYEFTARLTDFTRRDQTTGRITSA